MVAPDGSKSGKVHFLTGPTGVRGHTDVFIDGNCDERGTVEYNLALGERRAHAAMAYLVGLGVPAARLSMTSYGKEKPVCTEPAEPCWVRNRRDHFSLK